MASLQLDIIAQLQNIAGIKAQLEGIAGNGKLPKVNKALLAAGGAAAAGVAVGVVKSTTDAFREVESLAAQVEGVAGVEMDSAGASALEAQRKGWARVNKEMGVATHTQAEFGKMQLDALRTGASISEVGEIVPEIARVTMANPDVDASRLSEDITDLQVALAPSLELRGIKGVGNQLKFIGQLGTATANISNQNIEDYNEAMLKAGPAAQLAGVSATETSAFMALMADSGVKGSIAGRAFAETTSRIARAASGDLPKVHEGLEALGLSVEDLTTPDGLVDMVGLFGKLQKASEGLSKAEAGAALNKIFGGNHTKNVAGVIQQADKLLATVARIEKKADFGGKGLTSKLSERNAKTMNAALKSMSVAGNNLQVNMGEMFAPAVSSGLRFLATITDVVAGSKALTMALAGLTAIAGIGGAFTALAVGVGAIAPAFTAGIAAMKGLALAGSGVVASLAGVAVAAAPLVASLAVVAGAVALVAVAVAKLNGLTMGEFLAEISLGVQQTITDAQNLGSTIKSALSGVGSNISNVWSGLQTGLQQTISYAKDLGTALKSALSGVGSNISNVWSDLQTGLQQTITDAQGLGTALKSALSGTGSNISNVWSDLGIGLQQTIADAQSLGSALKTALSGAGSNISNVWSDLGIGLQQTIADAQNLGSALTTALSGIDLGNIWADLGTGLQQTIADFSGLFTNIQLPDFSGAFQPVLDIIARIKTEIAGFTQAIGNIKPPNLGGFFDGAKGAVGEGLGFLKQGALELKAKVTGVEMPASTPPIQTPAQVSSVAMNATAPPVQVPAQVSSVAMTAAAPPMQVPAQVSSIAMTAAAPPVQVPAQVSTIAMTAAAPPVQVPAQVSSIAMTAAAPPVQVPAQVSSIAMTAAAPPVQVPAQVSSIAMTAAVPPVQVQARVANTPTVPTPPPVSIRVNPPPAVNIPVVQPPPITVTANTAPAQAALGALPGAAAGAAAGVVGAMSGIPGAVAGIAAQIPGAFQIDLSGAGAAMMSSFASGIQSAGAAAVSAAASIAAQVRALMPGSDAETGPLSTISQWGGGLNSTFAKGIAGTASLPAKAMSGVASNLANTPMGSAIPSKPTPVTAPVATGGGGGGVVNSPSYNYTLHISTGGDRPQDIGKAVIQAIKEHDRKNKRNQAFAVV